MTASGVDPTDEDAVRGWIDAFNPRPREQREQLVPALENLPTAPSGSPANRKPAAKGTSAARATKAVRPARKRNRRR